ncbi:MAG: hypothetical protein IJI08_05735, partial [Clostridia bacterium]|nr:hypothetical protein [Clostridia bacterium]
MNLKLPYFSRLPRRDSKNPVNLEEVKRRGRSVSLLTAIDVLSKSKLLPEKPVHQVLVVIQNKRQIAVFQPFHLLFPIRRLWQGGARIKIVQNKVRDSVGYALYYIRQGGTHHAKTNQAAQPTVQTRCRQV